jgi:hypothetical protein
VRNLPASLVPLGTSPDFATLAEPRRRTENLRRRVSTATAALDRLAASRASRRRNPRLNLWPEILDWGPASELRRPAPPQPLAAGSAPPPAACMHHAPPDLGPAI